MTPLSIIIPAYNEGANFRSLWDELTTHVRRDFHAFVVYDFDEDDTLPVVNSIIAAGETRLTPVRNQRGPGVVNAILCGFAAAPEGPALVVMADCSDDLAQVDKMLALYRRGYHVVVGSRYMKGGRLVGGPLLKQSLSRLAGVSLFLMRGIPTHDATNAFKIYDLAMVRSFTIESRGGFELNLELTVKAFLNGYRITEVPATWRDRSAGTSKFKLGKWLPK